MNVDRTTVIDPVARVNSHGYPSLALLRHVNLLRDDLASMRAVSISTEKPLVESELRAHVDLHYTGLRTLTETFCYPDAKPDWESVKSLETEGYPVWLDHPTQKFMIKLEGFNFVL